MHTCIDTYIHTTYIHTYIHTYIYTCIHTQAFFINSKAKKLIKIHQKRKLTIKPCLPTTILLINCNNLMMICIT